jgi:hypothetical protein
MFVVAGDVRRLLEGEEPSGREEESRTVIA